ncbi:transmembrane protein [Rhynchospora pubera]|uniref:Transmembrane protein n=1 Tax=Rhynchospora pubera TaxID=906938 RepID=A0AAV8FVQ4_9POAL|nr:transmembrane protein [Rhynchospora pubera]
MKHHLSSRPPQPHRKRHRVISPVPLITLACTIVILILHSRTPSLSIPDPLASSLQTQSDESQQRREGDWTKQEIANTSRSRCATVEEMGRSLAGSRLESEKESLRIREIIRHHFDINGAERVRQLPAKEFCRHGFVLGKASEAGFGNEMYKILTGAALSIMLNRSLIIGQTRGLYPFGEYISYTNNSFTLEEVKHLWRKNRCAKKYGKALKIRVDNFESPTETNVLCSDWTSWKQPIIWFQGTTDAVGIQFFLKNIHPNMKRVASYLFGDPYKMKSRPNVFGELMRVLIAPSGSIRRVVNWVLNGVDPDIVLHMRMRSNRSIRAMNSAIGCVKKAIQRCCARKLRPRVLLISDTPSFVKEIIPFVSEFAEVLHFDYKSYEASNRSGTSISIWHQRVDFRSKDWGPAPRWVAFVDFFLASRAKHAVVSGAHRRVGTTYAQLIAALATANHQGNDPEGSDLTFFSSFQSNLLTDGLSSQVGWGHIWNRFAGPLSCHHQNDQCTMTPVLPPAWWDGTWQSPMSRDVHRLAAYGVRVSNEGGVDHSSLRDFCSSRKEHVKNYQIIGLQN